jgi:hypothetical protein
MAVSCTAFFVRRLMQDNQEREEMVKCVKRGAPYVSSSFSAILMIDLSGYSGLVSRLVIILAYMLPFTSSFSSGYL